MVKKNSCEKPPSFQFYYKDWLADSRLKRASKLAKGVWIDLMCWSMDMITPGRFSDENGPIPEQEIVELLSGNTKENKAGFAELKRRKIIKRDKEGVFYVKRLQRDMALSQIRREAGKQGGNPALVGNLVNQNANQNLTPSSSSSSSASNTPPNPPKGEQEGVVFETEKLEKETQHFQAIWVARFPHIEAGLKEIYRTVKTYPYESTNWAIEKCGCDTQGWGRVEYFLKAGGRQTRADIVAEKEHREQLSKERAEKLAQYKRDAASPEAHHQAFQKIVSDCKP